MTPDKYYTTLHLRSLHVSANIGLDAWGRPSRPQPLILSLSLIIDTTSAGPPDTLTNTFSYGQLAKDITSKISNGDFLSIDHLTSDLAGLADSWPGETLKLDILAPKALLLVEDGFGREIVLRRREVKTGEFRQLVWHVVSHEWFVRGLKCTCIIGMNPGERLEKQGVVIGLRIRGEKEKEDYAAQIREGPEMWRRLVREVCEVCWSLRLLESV